MTPTPRPAGARENVREYRKVATVLAGQAPTRGVIPTLEGDHTYEAGDYICGPGQAGEFWPVKRSIFEATYQPVEAAAIRAESSAEALDETWNAALDAAAGAITRVASMSAAARGDALLALLGQRRILRAALRDDDAPEREALG